MSRGSILGLDIGKLGSLFHNLPLSFFTAALLLFKWITETCVINKLFRIICILDTIYTFTMLLSIMGSTLLPVVQDCCYLKLPWA